MFHSLGVLQISIIKKVSSNYEKKIESPGVSLTLVLNNVSVNETATYIV